MLVNSKTVNLNNYLDQISNGDKKYEISSKEIIDDKNAEIIVDDKYKFALKDTEEGDVEVTYKGVATSSDLSISAKSGTYVYPTSGTFTVTNNASGGELTVSSDATNIATATIEGNTITVVPGTTAGKANRIVKSSANGDYAENKVVYVATVQNGTIELSVMPYTGIYDGKAHNAITKINVNPTDAKIEYSTDGTTYDTTMPTITDTSSFTVTVRASKTGYKTQIITETVKVNKAEGKLTLSATSGTYTYPTSGTFTVSGNIGTLSASSNNTNIATVSVSGNTVTVKPGTTAGKATITVTSAATTNYNSKSATYTATVNNGTISLSATPYTGTYDGKAHNAITKVTVTPSDAKIEYSTDGTNYSTTMPTITNISSFTVTIRASKAGYKTQTTTQTTKVIAVIDTVKIGDYVNYTYDTASAYKVQSKYSGYSSNQSITQTTGMKWRILNVDETAGTIDVLSEVPTSNGVCFNGILGYNNGPYLMNEICKAQYSNKSLGTYARNINLLDMEKHLTVKGIAERNAYTGYSIKVQYGKTNTYTSGISYYPSLYKKQKGAGINTTSVTQPDITKGNDPYEESKKIATTEPTTDSSAGQASSKGLTVTMTEYIIGINWGNYGDSASVLANSKRYWIASRAVYTNASSAAFSLRYADSSTSSWFMLDSTKFSGYTHYSTYLRPLVTLSSTLFTGTKDSSGAWNLK